MEKDVIWSLELKPFSTLSLRCLLLSYKYLVQLTREHRCCWTVQCKVAEGQSSAHDAEASHSAPRFLPYFWALFWDHRMQMSSWSHCISLASPKRDNGPSIQSHPLQVICLAMGLDHVFCRAVCLLFDRQTLHSRVMNDIYLLLTPAGHHLSADDNRR